MAYSPEAMFNAYRPCLPTRVTSAPTGERWVHEIKHDGFRIIVRRIGRDVRLFTKQGGDYSRRGGGRGDLISKNSNARRRTYKHEAVHCALMCCLREAKICGCCFMTGWSWKTLTKITAAIEQIAKAMLVGLRIARRFSWRLWWRSIIEGSTPNIPAPR
jgi:hypothetical protein